MIPGLIVVMDFPLLFDDRILRGRRILRGESCGMSTRNPGLNSAVERQQCIERVIVL